MNSDLGQLCRSCGLCCDGSLFGRVALEAAELGRARKNRLPIANAGRTFEQPCPALVPSGADGRQCSIYGERPRSCRKFECRLLDRHRREGGPLEPCLRAVRRVRVLIACIEGVHRDGDGASRAFVELRKRLDEDFARAGHAE